MSRRTNFMPHRSNEPYRENDRWCWCLYGEWHRYYGPVDHHGHWYMYGKFIKHDN